MSLQNDSGLVLDLWLMFRDAVVPGKREDLALQFLKVLEDYGADLKDIERDVSGEDRFLDEAFEALEEDNEENYDYDEED